MVKYITYSPYQIYEDFVILGLFEIYIKRGGRCGEEIYLTRCVKQKDVLILRYTDRTNKIKQKATK